MKPLHTVLLVLAPAPAALAQLPPLVITDAGTDKVWRCSDATGNGSYHDAGDVAVFYDGTTGSFPLSNNVGIQSALDGRVYVSDTSSDSIFSFLDGNGDGDADDAGESAHFFDGRLSGNLSNVLMPTPSSLVLDVASGAWFVPSSNAGSTGNDAIIRLIDSNNDGDANDSNEAFEYWTYPGTPTGESLPQGIELGLDGNVYFVDSPSTGPNGKGAYRLVDLNLDGDALDAGEKTAFFIPTFVATPFIWCLTRGADGWFYLADAGNEVVWRFRDVDGDGDAQDAGESSPWWTVGSTSNIWDLAAGPDGSIYAADSTPVSRVWRLFDIGGDGTIGAGDATVVYDETLASVVIGNPRGIELARELVAGTPFCFGDGSGVACPCGNAGAVGNGCANSIFAGGARLAGQGIASIANDTLALVGTQMPNSSALYFQGTTSAGGGLGLVFGDGLRCAGGSVIRLGTQFNVAGTSRYPAAGDPSVSVRGLDAPGDVRTYQAWYRNAASFCTADTFNLTNGVGLTWAP